MLKKVKSERNAADALTKAVGKSVMKMFNERIGAVDLSRQCKAADGKCLEAYRDSRQKSVQRNCLTKMPVLVLPAHLCAG